MTDEPETGTPPVPAPLTPAATPATTIDAADPDEHPGRHPTHRSSARRARLIALATAAAVLVLIAVLAALLLTDGDETTTAADSSVGVGEDVVPDLIGMPGQRALETLRSAGFTLGEPSSEPDPDVPAGNVVDQTPQAGTMVMQGAAVDLVFSHGAVPLAMPDVVGLTQEEATAALEEAGLVVSSVDSYDAGVADGVVIDQVPQADLPAATGMVVSIEVSRGPSGDADAVTVPDVTGMNVYEGAAALQEVGLTAQPFYDTETNEPQGTIIDQVPAAGSEVPAGSTVQITVSVGPQPPTVSTAE